MVKSLRSQEMVKPRKEIFPLASKQDYSTYIDWAIGKRSTRNSSLRVFNLCQIYWGHIQSLN